MMKYLVVPPIALQVESDEEWSREVAVDGVSHLEIGRV